ncbi:hypothetical protein O181_073113, partial [Austropuccinia psidii MF-1]|nr:hypothetical protein [Austropuccinia psidii MF-1]
EEEKIQQENKVTGSDKIKQVSPVKHQNINSIFEEWIQQELESNIEITGDVILQKWKEFSWLAGIPSNKWLHLSNGWLQSFKNRNDLRNYKKNGELGGTDPVILTQEITFLKKVLDKYNPADIFNMDETGLFYAMPPTKTLHNQNQKE